MSHRARSFLSGALIANSAVHLASAVAKRRHLTPLAGRESSPTVNLVWGLANLVSGCVVLRTVTRSTPQREPHWDSDLLWFESGHLATAFWMAASERVLRTNSGS